MKNVYACLLAFVLFVFSVNIAEARNGCCSHHGGVCGCGCCDGTSLSSTCAPYYPQCNGPISTPKPTPKPTIVHTPKPSFKPTSTPTPTPKPTPTISPSPKVVQVPTSTPVVLGASTSDSDSSNWTTAIVASLVGAGAYHLATKGKPKAS